MKNKLLISLLSVFILFSRPNGYGQALQPIIYNDGAQKLNGLLGIPRTSDKKKAGVLILHAWMGVDENAKASAKKLTALGYYAMIADIYGEGNYPTDKKKAKELSSYYKNNVNEYRKRIYIALQKLIDAGADSNNIVVIGYCFGGTGALEAARANLNIKGAVSFHGGLGRDSTKAITDVRPKILVCHGAADPSITEAQIKGFQNEMNLSKADWQMIFYANAVHAFTDLAAGTDPSKGSAYDEKAAKRSWSLMLQFLEEVTH